MFINDLKKSKSRIQVKLNELSLLKEECAVSKHLSEDNQNSEENLLKQFINIYGDFLSNNDTRLTDLLPKLTDLYNKAKSLDNN